MIPILYLYEQEPQEVPPEEQIPPEEQGSLADRIFNRAVQRIPNPEVDEEVGIEDEVMQRIDQEKRAAKVGARVAEERNKDPELKQLKAAEAIHNKETAEDTKALETGQVPEKVAQDKAEIEATKQAEARSALQAKMTAKETVAPGLSEKEEEKLAAQQAPPEGNSQGQVAEVNIQDYI